MLECCFKVNDFPWRNSWRKLRTLHLPRVPLTYFHLSPPVGGCVQQRKSLFTGNITSCWRCCVSALHFLFHSCELEEQQGGPSVSQSLVHTGGWNQTCVQGLLTCPNVQEVKWIGERQDSSWTVSTRCECFSVCSKETLKHFSFFSDILWIRSSSKLCVCCFILKTNWILSKKQTIHSFRLNAGRRSLVSLQHDVITGMISFLLLCPHRGAVSSGWMEAPGLIHGLCTVLCVWEEGVEVVGK